MSLEEKVRVWGAISRLTKDSSLSEEETVDLFFNKIALVCLDAKSPESSIDAGLRVMKRNIDSVADDKGIEFDWSKVKLMNA